MENQVKWQRDINITNFPHAWETQAWGKGRGESYTLFQTLPTKLLDVIDSSIEVEEHSDYKKVNGKRNSDNGIGDGNMLVHRMYGAVEIEGMTYTE